MKSWKFENGAEIHWGETGKPLEFKSVENSIYTYLSGYGLIQLTGSSTLEKPVKTYEIPLLINKEEI